MAEAAKQQGSGCKWKDVVGSAWSWGGGKKRKFHEQLLKSNLDKMSLDAHLGWTEVDVQLGLTADAELG